MSAYIGDYGRLLEGFLARGYRPLGFGEHRAAEGELLLRHDIDFDCGLAHDMAKIEAGLGVLATYFFMLSSDSYNLLSAANLSRVRAIQALGHRISLHFDPTVHEDFAAGFQAERAIFEATFEAPLEIVSIHRPNSFFLDHDEPIAGVAHTYQRRFARDVAYISDSQGRFRFGHPHESAAFAARRTIHLLIHPIWWMVPNPRSAIDLLGDFLHRHQQAYQQHMARNCIPYRDYLEGAR
jgi:hypothetical protein